uniref:General transcription and DNA repair factor IIH subunit TFB5 n=1 Tax=Timema poppense TaxID=170557 RepID=A0A7R9H3C3_TIMPO|nr:unnamed protein product [Timema poppensis]
MMSSKSIFLALARSMEIVAREPRRSYDMTTVFLLTISMHLMIFSLVIPWSALAWLDIARGWLSRNAAVSASDLPPETSFQPTPGVVEFSPLWILDQFLPLQLRPWSPARASCNPRAWLTSDQAMKQFLLHLDETIALGRKFIIQDLDETHLFISADIVETLQARIDDLMDQISFPLSDKGL